MSTTDNAFSATLEPINKPKASLKQRWWHVMDSWKVGIIPLPLFCWPAVLSRWTALAASCRAISW